MKWIRHKEDKVFHMYDPYLEMSLCNGAEKPRIHDAVAFVFNKSDPNTMCEKCKETFRLGKGIRKFLEG
jgi:hypothetical protein